MYSILQGNNFNFTNLGLWNRLGLVILAITAVFLIFVLFFVLIYGEKDSVSLKMTIGAPVTPSSKIKRAPACTPGGPKVREENILVTVRMRPLNSKEVAAYDLVAWEITDENTIVSKNLHHERHGGLYTFGICSNLYKDTTRFVVIGN